MFDRELNSFLLKFHQLRKSGVTAHLDVDTYAGQAWVGLRVMLGPIQHQPTQRHRSPSYFRRQEKRRAARQSSEESDRNKVVAEEVATDTKEKSAAEATTIENVAKDFRCEICDFKSNRATGLQVHMSRKHATIEQLDGNTSLPFDENEKVIVLRPDMSEEVDEEIEHFLQYGFIRNPSVRNYGRKLWLCIGDEMRKCGLSWEVRQANSKNDLTVHIRSTHQLKDNICSICGKTFTKTNSLERHMNDVHSTQKCDTCVKSTSSKSKT